MVQDPKPQAAKQPATPVEGQLRKPDLIDQVVTRSTVKKRDAKLAVDSMLGLLAEALARGDELNLPPLGKLRVIKSKDIGGGAQVMTLKLRTMKEGAGKGGGGQGNSCLAETGDDD